MSRGVMVLLMCFGLACTPQPRPELLDHGPDAGQTPGAADGGADAGAEDRDHDGLCDLTELDIGSDPDQLDSDHDGLPDGLELINVFDPLSPESPSLDQIAFLPAKHGASVDFDVRATVEGAGESYTGTLTSYSTFDPELRTADDFFVSGVAKSAEPPENVRSIDAEAERFDGVLGRTRLSFGVRFAYSSNVDFECAQGFSFSYETKTDQGRYESSRDYLLVITPKDAVGIDPTTFCLPPACL